MHGGAVLVGLCQRCLHGFALGGARALDAKRLARLCGRPGDAEPEAVAPLPVPSKGPPAPEPAPERGGWIRSQVAAVTRPNSRETVDLRTCGLPQGAPGSCGGKNSGEKETASESVKMAYRSLKRGGTYQPDPSEKRPS